MKRYRIALFAVPAIIGLSTFIFLGSRCAAFPQPVKNNVKKDKALLSTMLKILDNNHYRPVTIDNDFSHKVYDTYLKRLDYRKQFFLQPDIDMLKNKFYDGIDDEIKGSTFEFFDSTISILNRRITEDKVYYTDALAKPFDFSVKESVQLDPEKCSYPADKAAMKDSWRKYLKYQVMVRYVDAKKNQDKDLNDDKNLDKTKKSIIMMVDSAGTKIKKVKPVKADSTLEREARMKVKKLEDDYFDRLTKAEHDDYMTSYLNVIVGIFDPHTEFFPPNDKENFDITMTGQLKGIGATLQEDNGNIKVTSIVPGSPSWKQGQLKPGDLILKVAQGDQEPVDIVGKRVDDAVKLIRGEKGTEVRLTVQKPDGSIIVIPIIRDIVVLEETYAQSAMIDQDKKIGYIRLPGFYADFSRDHSSGRACSDDVKKELEKLKSENVKGVILDLRDNGGGSLYEVIKMVGLFIPQGPVVQVKTLAQGIAPYGDDDNGKTVYDGPLVVLINDNSASASEILAAAIQDYHRGLIVGSSASTFGKGTVQNFYDLDDTYNGDDDFGKLGSLKVTIQKFYRINGGSTQLKGVTPDIELPGYYDFDKTGEKDLDYPMEWDQIPSAKYDMWKNEPAYGALQKASADRVAKSTYFALIRQKEEQLKRERDNTDESLFIDDYKAERQKIEDENKAFKPLEDPVKGMNVSILSSDMKVLKGDTAMLARKNDFIDKVKKDPWISESAWIASDMKK
ncbi:MAG TPA: carboxy terminal-processing peptidase [Bacteroidia bacterium]|nr:carboxy terminal-processing peptidase [Bacteroidia bacterium]